MKVTLTKKQIEKVIEELVEYQNELDKEFPEEKKLKYVKTYKEFLIDKKVEELIDKLVSREKEFKIEVLVVDSGQESIFQQSELLLEWEQYKKIPKTNLTYRYDKGKGRPGMDDHIHVYLRKTKNQVYAINKSGTPHDGSKAKLSNKEVKFLKNIGFTPPKNGILEWITLPSEKAFVAYKRQLLLS